MEVMARSIRIEYCGAFYHVMARGNRRDWIFVDDEDRETFLRTLGEVCGMTGWRIHAWVLMSNHYHVFVQTPEANLVDGMKWLQNTYTRRFNVRHRGWGRLFGDRYKAIIIDGRTGFYYESLVDYIHLNPVRAGLVSPECQESVSDYPWSSLASAYAVLPERRPRWMACAEALSLFGYADTVEGRRGMVERLDRRAVAEEATRCGIPVIDAEVDARMSNLQRGWYWGTQAFAENLLLLGKGSIAKPRSTAYNFASEQKAHHLGEAERLLQEGLERCKLHPDDLFALNGSDSRKLAIAAVIRRRTTVSNGWLATNLSMKSAANVSQGLRKWNSGIARKPLPETGEEWMRSNLNFEP